MADAPADAEARFQRFLELSGEPYESAVRAAGAEPWHGGDIEVRRELFMRRYTPPTHPPSERHP